MEMESNESLAVLNQARVGQWTHESLATVDADQARRYAAATNDDNARLLSGEVAPPGLAVALAGPPGAEAMQHAFEADPYTLGSVHGEQDLYLHRPLGPGMQLRQRAAVVGV